MQRATKQPKNELGGDGMDEPLTDTTDLPDAYDEERVY